MTDPDLLYKQIRKTTIIKNTSIVILIITMIILFFGTLKSYDNYLRYKNDMKEANGYWIDVIE